MAYDLTLPGIVVGEMLLNDNDKLLTVITAKKGKMIALAKGIKSIKSKRSAGAQLFCYSDFCFVKREDRLWLDAIEVKDNFQGISDDVRSLALASYFAEVARQVCMEGNEEPEMLRLMLNSMYALSNLKEKPHWMIKAAFELQCMCIQGFTPNFDECCICGSKHTLQEKNIVFELMQGGFVCGKCSSDETFEISKDGYAISRNTYDAIKYICTSPQTRMLSFSIPSQNIKEFSRIAEQYIIVQTEKKFDTLEYYNKNFLNYNP